MRRVFFATVLATTFTATAAHAADGTASGTFTVNGKTTTLAYAYAMARPDPFDKTKEAITLVLSDAKLTPAQLDDPFALQKLMNANQLHAITAIIQQSKDVATTMLYDSGFKFDSVSVAGTNNKFEAQTFNATTIAGKFSTAKPDTFAKATYEFSATFTAPIQRVAASAASKPVSADDPIVKAAMAYLKAAHAGDGAALKLAVVPEVAPDLSGPHGKDIVAMLKAMTSATPTITKLDTAGDMATVTFEEKDESTTSTSTLKLKKVAAGWRVDPR